MIRKINYTGRRKIPLKAITIRKLNNGMSNYFTLGIDFKDLDFPPEAKVYIEAYFNANFVRFDFGEVGNFRAPADTSLDELPGNDGIRYRIKVIDESGVNGKILGVAENVIALNEAEDGNRESILPVRFCNLKDQIWKIDFDNDSPGPILLVNDESRFPNIRIRLKTDPVFFGLIYPMAIRIVLNKIKEDNKFDSDSDDWSTKWLRFSAEVLGVYPTPSNSEESDIDFWIDEVVNNFCMKFKIIKNIISI